MTSLNVALSMPQDIYNYAEQDYNQDDSGFGVSTDVNPISGNDLMVVQQLEGLNRPRQYWESPHRSLDLFGLNNNKPVSGSMTSPGRRIRRNRGRDGLVGRVLGRRGNGESGWDVYRICSLGVRLIAF